MLVVHRTTKSTKCILWTSARATEKVCSCPQSFSAATRYFQRLVSPTHRANSYCDRTNLFCRLPLSTLFYRLEAANLGDLMLLFVRQGLRISHATRFSRIVESAPKQLKGNCFYQHFNPISGQSDSRVNVVVNTKRKLVSELPQMSPALLVLPLVSNSLCRNINLLPFR